MATFMLFISGIFGTHAPVPPPASQGDQAGSFSHLSIDEIMQQIGCRDETACVAVCESGRAPHGCSELKELMKTQGTWPQSSTPSPARPQTLASNGSSNSSSQTSSRQTPDARGLPGEEHAVAYAGDGTAVNAGTLPNCPAGNNAFFDTAPLGNITGIKPLGNMNGGHILPNQADHVYVDSSLGGDIEVHAPGAAELLQIVTQADQTGLEGNRVTIYFSPCKSVMFAYQFDSLSPALKQAIADQAPIQVQNSGDVMHNTIYRTDIPLTSGEVLGTVSGELDFAAADVRTPPLEFLDMSAATGMLADSYLHAVCPLDYFAEPMRSTLRGLLTIKNAGENGIPQCGAIMQDEAGTAQGNWYKQGANFRNGIMGSDLLAIVHSNLNPAEGVVSFGTSLKPSEWLGTQIVFMPAESGVINREPSEVTPDGKTYCFDGPAGAGGQGGEGHLTIAMTSATELKAAFGDGSCSTVPILGPGALTYER